MGPDPFAESPHPTLYTHTIQDGSTRFQSFPLAILPAIMYDTKTTLRLHYVKPAFIPQC